MTVQQEYERIKILFAGVDEKQVDMIDGAIWETARLRVELNNLNQLVQETGLIKTNPKNPLQQKELPVSRMIVKARANYLNYIAKLAGILGRRVDDEDDGLDDYE